MPNNVQTTRSREEEIAHAATLRVPADATALREISFFRQGFEQGATWADLTPFLPPTPPAADASKPNALQTRRAIASLKRSLAYLVRSARQASALSFAEILQAVTPFVAEILCAEALAKGDAARHAVSTFSIELRRLVGRAHQEHRRRKQSLKQKQQNNELLQSQNR